LRCRIFPRATQMGNGAHGTRWSWMEQSSRRLSRSLRPRDALRALEARPDTSSAWQELWAELRHQGDIGEASYVAVPHLVRIHAHRGVPDWNTYALVATIERCRLRGRNPAVPQKLRSAYTRLLGNNWLGLRYRTLGGE